MARGHSTIEKYLVYEGTDYDANNAPKGRRKNERLANLELGIVLCSYPLVLILLIFLFWTGVLAILIIVSITGTMEIWRRLMAYYEVKKHGPSLHLKLYYQDLDGAEGELFLDNVVIADRLTIKPLELLTEANAAEHVIRSGIDERRLTAESTKEHLSDNIKEKLQQLEKLAKDRDQSVLDAVSAMDFLRRYFNLEEGDPVEEIPAQIKEQLDELRHMILDIEIPLDMAPEIRENLPILKIYPKSKLFIKTKTKETVKKDGKTIEIPKGTEIEVDPNTRLNPAEVIWFWLNADGIERDVLDLTLFKEGLVTNEMKKKLRLLYQAAKARDEKIMEMLKNTDLIKRYFGISIPYWSGQVDSIKKFNPHIYTIYPNSDLRRRCVIVFSVPFGEAIKKDSKIHVNFDYTGFAGLGGVVEAVRLAPVNEVLLEGAEIQGVPIELPEDMFAVSTDIPLFIATAFDYTDELARKGMRATRPPAETSMFVQVVKSLTDLKTVLGKYQRALREINRLKREEKEEKVKDDTDKAEQGMDMSPLIDPDRLPVRTEYVEIPYPTWKMGVLIIAGIVLGFLLTIISLRLLGFVIINPVTGDWIFGGRIDAAEWVKWFTKIPPFEQGVNI